MSIEITRIGVTAYPVGAQIGQLPRWRTPTEKPTQRQYLPVSGIACHCPQ